MEIGGTNALDNLASNGIIDFDADAYVRGTPPRYVGDPDGPQYLPFERPLMAEPTFVPPIGTRLSGQPQRDEFGRHEKKHSKLNWKQALTGVIVAGLLVLGGIKCKDKVGKLVAKFKKTKAPAEPKQGLFAKVKSKVTELFGKKKSNEAPKTAEAVNNATEAAKDTAKTVKKAKLPKWAKIAGGSLAGLAGLYGIYKVKSGRGHNEQVQMIVPNSTMALNHNDEQAIAAEPMQVTAVEPQPAVTA